MTTTRTTTSTDMYAEVTSKLLAAMEGGTAPWRSPYLATGQARSMSTGKPYRGINSLLLPLEAMVAGYASPWWGTFKQINELGGKVTKGSKATKVVFWKRLDREETDPATGEVTRKGFMMLRHFNVFNADQCEWDKGLPKKFATAARADDFVPSDAAEAIVAAYLANGGPTLVHEDQTLAYYRPSTDTVNVPDPKNIASTDQYYSTLFHELGHSTGHESRLAREGVTMPIHNRGTVYSYEELIAEFTAGMLCNLVGITDTLDNSAAYLKHWGSFLRDDPKAAVRAAGAAQRAVDCICGVSFTED